MKKGIGKTFCMYDSYYLPRTSQSCIYAFHSDFKFQHSSRGVNIVDVFYVCLFVCLFVSPIEGRVHGMEEQSQGQDRKVLIT